MSKKRLRPLHEVLPKWLRDPAFREGFQSAKADDSSPASLASTEWISVADAAGRLNVSEDFVLRKGAEGALPVTRLGIPLGAFERFATEMKASQDAALDELLNLSCEKGGNRKP